MKSPVQILIAIAILLATATVCAQVYRWVDKDGKVNYTDTPPPKDVKDAAKKIDARPASSTSDGVDRAKATVKNNKEADKRKESAAEAAKKADDEAKLAANHAERCKDAKRNLANFESGRPLNTNDEKGERTFMGDEERKANIKKSQDVIAESCK
jgi:hypothetical protein